MCVCVRASICACVYILNIALLLLLLLLCSCGSPFFSIFHLWKLLLGPVWIESLQNTKVKFPEMQKVLSHFFLFCFDKTKNEKQKEELCVCVCTWMHMPLCTVTLLMLVTHLDKLCLLCWLWRFEIMNRYVNIFDYASIQTKTKRVVRSVGFFCCDDSWSCLCGVLS